MVSNNLLNVRSGITFAIATVVALHISWKQGTANCASPSIMTKNETGSSLLTSNTSLRSGDSFSVATSDISALEGNASSSLVHPPTLQEDPLEFCMETNRCQKMSTANRMSFLHISKSGGSSWIQELKLVLPKNLLFPQANAGYESSVVYQNKENRFDHLSKHLTALRSPRHHMWSLWSECRFDEWGKVSQCLAVVLAS